MLLTLLDLIRQSAQSTDEKLFNLIEQKHVIMTDNGFKMGQRDFVGKKRGKSVKSCKISFSGKQLEDVQLWRMAAVALKCQLFFNHGQKQQHVRELSIITNNSVF